MGFLVPNGLHGFQAHFYAQSTDSVIFCFIKRTCIFVNEKRRFDEPLNASSSRKVSHEWLATLLTVQQNKQQKQYPHNTVTAAAMMKEKQLTTPAKLLL